MDALPTLPAELPLTGIPGGALRLLGEGDWTLEPQLSEVPDVPVWTLYPARMSGGQARRRVRANRERAAAGRAGRRAGHGRGPVAGAVGVRFRTPVGDAADCRGKPGQRERSPARRLCPSGPSG